MKRSNLVSPRRGPRSGRAALVLVLLGVLLVGLGWFVFRDAPASEAPIGTGGPAAPAGSARPEATRELDPSSADAGETSAATAVESARRQEAAPGAALRSDWNREEARWLEGRLNAPGGTPADPTLRVVAMHPDDVQRFGGLQELFRGGFDEDDFIDGLRHQKGALSSAPVAADGSFRLAFPPDLERGFLEVDGRYLYLSQPLEVALADEAPLQVEPALGAWVHGRVPAAARRGCELFLTLELSGFNPMMFEKAATATRLERPDAEGRFELRGLEAELPYQLLASAESQRSEEALELELRPGEERELSLTFGPAATLVGRVQDDQGRAIAGAEVRLERWDDESSPGFGGNMMNSILGTVWGRTLSDENGSFRFTGVRPGTVELEAEAEGYRDDSSPPITVLLENGERVESEEPLDYDDFETYDGETETWSIAAELEDDEEDREELTVRAGEVLEGVVLELDRGASLAGRVRWADGTPAAGAEVSLSTDFDEDEGWRRWAWDTPEAETDEAGRFFLSGLREDATFNVTAEAELEDELGLPRGGEATLHGIAVGASDLSLVLDEVPMLEGRVVDSTGAPVTSFELLAFPQVEGEGARWMSRRGQRSRECEHPEGLFRMALKDGEWSLVAEAEGYGRSDPLVVVTPSAAPVTITLERAARVEGLVVDPSGRGVPGATISTGTFNWMQASGEVEEPDPTTVFADARGRFAIDDLKPGGITLSASYSGFAASDPLGVELLPGELRGDVTLSLRLGGTITGEVYKKSEPVAEANVMAWIMGESRSHSGTTNASGEFRIDNVEPGSWQVVVMPDSFGGDEEAADEEEGSGGLWGGVKMKSVEVVEGEEVHVIFGEEPAEPVMLRGRVTQAGDPVRATLTFTAEGGTAEDIRRAVSDADGNYSIKLNYAGDYLVLLTRGEDRFNWNGGLQQRLRVPRADEHSHDFELPMGRISGRVVGPDGEPVVDENVSIRSEGGVATGMLFGGRYEMGETDEDGYYSFGDLAAGSYAVSVGSMDFGGGEGSFGQSIRRGLELKEGGVLEGVDFELVEAVHIRGRVVDQEGNPVSGASVFARDQAGRVVQTFSTVITSSSGRFRMEGLEPGAYSFSARGESGASTESALVDVDGSDDEELELRLEDGTMVTVVFEDAGDVALVATVTVTDEAGRQVNGLYMVEDMFSSFTGGGLSATEQRFGPIPPGEYTARATLEDGRELERRFLLRGQAERRVILRLRD